MYFLLSHTFKKIYLQIRYTKWKHTKSNKTINYLKRLHLITKALSILIRWQHKFFNKQLAVEASEGIVNLFYDLCPSWFHLLSVRSHCPSFAQYKTSQALCSSTWSWVPGCPAGAAALSQGLCFSALLINWRDSHYWYLFIQELFISSLTSYSDFKGLFSLSFHYMLNVIRLDKLQCF